MARSTHEPSVHRDYSSVKWWSPAARVSHSGSWCLHDIGLLQKISKHHSNQQQRHAKHNIYIISYHTLFRFNIQGVHFGNRDQPKLWHGEVITTMWNCVNTSRPRQNGRHLPNDIFLNENVWILIKTSLKFVPKGLINNIPSLIQIMAWRRAGDKPLSGPMMVSLLMHICVTRPQWVEVITHPCPHFNGSLAKLPLKFEHGRVMTSRLLIWK